MKRRLVTALLAGVGLTATIAVAPASAVEGGSCSVAMPATVVINSPITELTVPLAEDCVASEAHYAEWTVVNPRTGDSDFLGYYGPMFGTPGTPLQPIVTDYERTDWISWYDDSASFGTFTVVPDGAQDIHGNALTQNEMTIVAKAASKATRKTTRNRSTVVVTAGASYYNARQNKQIPWAGAQVQIQSSNAVDGRWTTVATVTTGADGLASKAIYAPSARYWRVLTPNTTSVFHRYSVPVRA